MGYKFFEENCYEGKEWVKTLYGFSVIDYLN